MRAIIIVWAIAAVLTSFLCFAQATTDDTSVSPPGPSALKNVSPIPGPGAALPKLSTPGNPLSGMPFVSNGIYGSWRLLCTTRGPKVCALAQQAESSHEPLIWTRVYFSVFNEKVVMRVRTPRIASQEVEIVVDGAPIASAVATSCDDESCETIFSLKNGRYRQLLMARTASIVPANFPNGVSLNLNGFYDGMYALLDALGY